MNSAWLWSRARLAVNKKNRNISRYQTTNLVKTWFLFLICKKEQKQDKREFVTKSVGMIGLFSCTNISQIARKTFATQLFLIDHMNHKIVNKTTCRTPSANPRQLWVHLLKSFRTVAIIFWGFEDFLIYLAKYVWSLLNSPNLGIQKYFARAM